MIGAEGVPACPCDTRGMRATTATLAALGAAGAAALAYARWEAQSYRLRRAHVPTAMSGPDLRVLHLSDLHVTPRRRRLVDWLASLRELRPDLVVVTGDFLAHPEAVPTALAALEPLLDQPGAFVLGSNDYYAPSPVNPLAYLAGPSGLDSRRAELPWPELIGGLTEAGWAHLGNAEATVVAGDRAIALRGVDDPHIGRDDYARVAGPMDAGADLRLGVAHAPYRRVVDAMAADEADLVLAGHTHGGQVRVPGVGALVTNCDLPAAQARGLTRRSERTWLHVSAGLGTSPYAPIRFACPPEATLLTLTAGG